MTRMPDFAHARAYRPDIDGLRALAVVGVVLNHLSAGLLPGGYVGVDVFFVISGYLITGIVMREARGGNFSLAGFYERRIRRLLPAFSVVLASTLLAGYWLLLPRDYDSTAGAALSALVFASNIFFWRDAKEGYFAALDASLNPLLHTWSLGVEEQFYLVFPLLLVWLSRRADERMTRLIFTALALGSLIMAAWLLPSKKVAVFFLLPFRAWELLLGALLALGCADKPWFSHWSRRCIEVVAAMGLCMILGAMLCFDHATPFPGLHAVLPCLGAVLVMAAGGVAPTWTSRLLSLRWVVAVGLMSYSLYLWHWPVLVFARYGGGWWASSQAMPWILLLCGLFAALSYRWIERPLRYGTAQRKWVVGSGLMVSMSLAVAAGLVLLGNGLRSRVPEQAARMDDARFPSIPFVRCDDRPASQWCVLGDPQAEPSVLLWGDSHMLAWAPAFDRIMAARGQSAWLAVRSACVPMLAAQAGLAEACLKHNEAVRRLLESRPEIKQVVLSANWRAYGGDAGRLQPGVNVDDNTLQRLVSQIDQTVVWLMRDRRVDAYLLGQVPVYSKSVPFMLALQAFHSTSPAPIDRSELDLQQRLGLEIDHRHRGQERWRYGDPIEWLCRPTCTLQDAEGPFYRDAHHLSVHGVLGLQGPLADRLAPVPPRLQAAPMK